MADTVTIPARYFWPLHHEYLQSPEWSALRDRVIERDGGICRQCGGPSEVVHHLTYERWRNEMLFDLVSLCLDCHDRAHERGAHAPAAPAVAPVVASGESPQARIDAMSARIMRHLLESSDTTTAAIDLFVAGDYHVRRVAIDQLERRGLIRKVDSVWRMRVMRATPAMLPYLEPSDVRFELPGAPSVAAGSSRYGYLSDAAPIILISADRFYDLSNQLRREAGEGGAT